MVIRCLCCRDAISSIRRFPIWPEASSTSSRRAGAAAHRESSEATGFVIVRNVRFGSKAVADTYVGQVRTRLEAATRRRDVASQNKCSSQNAGPNEFDCGKPL